MHTPPQSGPLGQFGPVCKCTTTSGSSNNVTSNSLSFLINKRISLNPVSHKIVVKLNFVENKVGEVVGKEYVKRHYPEKAALKMDELIKHLIAAYKESFENLTWLSEETKKLALLKLSKFNPKVGSPKVWEDYSNLDLKADESLLTYASKVNKFEFAKDFRELKEPVNRDKWYITPQTVNAYYMASLNEIVFPAAILQAPFFDVDADDAVNYGAIGAIIGHEIGHGFDDQGSKYDGDGNLVSWWSVSDRANF